MNILWTRICFDLLKITTKFLTCLKLNYMLKHKIETWKSDFDSASESESDSSLALIN